MAADTPSFSSSADIDVGTITTANTNRDGTGAVVTIATGAATGTRIERIRAKAQGTTTTGMVRLMLFNASGTFVHLFAELSVAAATPSDTVQSWQGDLVYGAATFFVLPSGWTIRASTAKTETFTLAIYVTE